MQSLRVPSGVELTLTNLFRVVAKLTPVDVNFIFTDRKAKKFRKPVGELLGKAFAGTYNKKRETQTKKRLDFWKVGNGTYRKKFIAAAVNAKMNGFDPVELIYRAVEFARDKSMGVYPTPHLVCGDFVLGEVLNGWRAASDEPALPDVTDDLGSVDAGSETWIWQPGYRFDSETGKFVRDADSD